MDIGNKGGILYVVSNPSMPNLFKIGMTQRNPEERIKEPHVTGVPEPFVPEYFHHFRDASLAERLVHNRLKNYRHTRCSTFKLT